MVAHLGDDRSLEGLRAGDPAWARLGPRRSRTSSPLSEVTPRHPQTRSTSSSSMPPLMEEPDMAAPRPSRPVATWSSDRRAMLGRLSVLAGAGLVGPTVLAACGGRRRLWRRVRRWRVDRALAARTGPATWTKRPWGLFKEETGIDLKYTGALRQLRVVRQVPGRPCGEAQHRSRHHQSVQLAGRSADQPRLAASCPSTTSPTRPTSSTTSRSPTSTRTASSPCPTSRA